MFITSELATWLKKNTTLADNTTDTMKHAVVDAMKDGKLTAKMLAQLSGGGDAASANLFAVNSDGSGTVSTPAVGRNYSTTKSAILNPKTGRPLIDPHSRVCETISMLEYAKCGAFLKLLAKRGGQQIELTDHDRQLLDETYAKDTWVGDLGDIVGGVVDGMRVKSLLNDATSGGANVTPEWFDINTVSYPLLHSELMPYVDLQPVPRGSEVAGAAIGNPTIQWGPGEGTEVGLWNTDALISAIDTSIHDVNVAVEVGLNLMSDSPVQIGEKLMSNIGQAIAKEMDKVIAGGSGTDRPTGIRNASGLPTINSDNGAGGPPTLHDILALMFGISKQYRTPELRPCYISNDTLYQRTRNLKVDPANPSTDQRLVLGMDVQSYNTLGAPHRIQNDLANTVGIFGCLAKYRLFRRLGNTVVWTTEGRSLALANTALLVVRARYGGQVMDPSAFAICEDLQS